MALDIQISRNFPNFISQGLANCATTDPDAFFPERGANASQNRVAKRICMTCQYIEPCLAWAMENRETGIWGATTEADRRKLRRKKSSR